MAWPPRGPIHVREWRFQVHGWWAFRLLWWGCVLPRSGPVRLVVGSQHLFMVGSGGDNMTTPTLVRNSS